jgi:hypothetical protein
VYFPKYDSKIATAFFIYLGLLVLGMTFTNPAYKAGLSARAAKLWMGYLGPAIATGLILYQVYGGPKTKNSGLFPILWGVFGVIISSLGGLESGKGVTILVVFLAGLLWLGDVIGRNGKFNTARKWFEETSEEQFVTHFTQIKSFPFENRDLAKIRSLEDMKRVTYFLERSNQKITLTYCKTIIFKERSLSLIKFESPGLFGALMVDPERQRASLDISGKKINREYFKSDVKLYLLTKLSPKDRPEA